MEYFKKTGQMEHIGFDKAENDVKLNYPAYKRGLLTSAQ
jgi:hypothetical protein